MVSLVRFAEAPSSGTERALVESFASWTRLTAVIQPLGGRSKGELVLFHVSMVFYIFQKPEGLEAERWGERLLGPQLRGSSLHTFRIPRRQFRDSGLSNSITSTCCGPRSNRCGHASPPLEMPSTPFQAVCRRPTAELAGGVCPVLGALICGLLPTCTAPFLLTQSPFLYEYSFSCLQRLLPLGSLPICPKPFRN